MNVNRNFDSSLPMAVIQESVTNYTYAKPFISCRLFHKDDNVHLKPYIPRMPVKDTDLVMCFAVQFEQCAILVIDSLLEAWGETINGVVADWISSTVHNSSAIVRPLDSVISEMMADGSSSIHMTTDAPTVITNEARCYGAGEIMRYEVRKKLLTLYPDGCWILPSSVHEVIAVPIQPDDSVDRILSMVREINAEQVADSDRLSNNIYQLYDVDTLIQIGEAPWDNFHR